MARQPRIRRGAAPLDSGRLVSGRPCDPDLVAAARRAADYLGDDDSPEAILLADALARAIACAPGGLVTLVGGLVLPLAGLAEVAALRERADAADEEARQYQERLARVVEGNKAMWERVRVLEAAVAGDVDICRYCETGEDADCPYHRRSRVALAHRSDAPRGARPPGGA